MMDNSRVRSAQVMSVIVVRSVTGKGIQEDPAREITQYFSLDGELLATVDTWMDTMHGKADQAQEKS